MRITKNLCALMGCALLATASTVSAANLDFNNPDGDWFTPTNWTPAGPPTNLDNARIGTLATQATAIAHINSGGTADAKNVILGLDAGTDGTLRINNGSTLNVANNFTVGAAGTGTFFSLDSTTTNITGDMIVGNQSGAVGTANIRDTSTVDIGGFLRIGNQAGSIGSMDVNTQSHAILGAGVAAGGIAGNIVVGNAGTGDLTVRDGAVVGSFNAIVIGNQATGVGTVILRGEDSTGTTPSILATLGGNGTVGDQGQGTLEVRDGAQFNLFGMANGNLRIGRQAGSIGSVLVTGVGPVSGNSSSVGVGGLFVGGDNGGVGGQGLLTIKNGGVVDATGNMIVWGVGSGSRSELDVDSTYTLNVLGTLNFNGGGLRFLGDGTDFVNDATLNNIPGPDLNGMHVTVAGSNTATISGELDGDGHLVKEGNGTLVLSNVNNTYGGGTNINNGTLVVGTGSTAGNTVLGHGDVNLNGDIDTILRTPEGTPLTYDVLGDFNANTGKLLAQIGGTNNGVQSDEMFVFGNANLDPANSHLFAHRINGYNPNNGDVVTIIAALAVNGEFGDAPQGTQVPNDFIGLIRPFADYSIAGQVDLDFAFAASFASIAKTPNQIATATALDNAVAAGCIVNATNVLGNVSPLLLRSIYDLIAPEELASMYEASFAQGMAQSLNLQHRMDDIRWGSTGFCADGFVIQDNHGYTKNDGKSVADKNPVEQVAPPNYRWGSFITGTGELTKVGQEDDNAAGYQLNNASFTMGVDYRVTDHWAIGLSGGYTHTSGQLVNDGHLNTDGGRLGLYTTWGSGGFYVDASASGGWNQYDTRRTGYLGQDEGSTDGGEFDGMIAAGYDWKRGCWIFGPYADFEYSYVEFNAFSEDDRASSSSLIPLHYPDQNQNAYRTNVGLRVAHEQVMKPGEGLTVVPELRVAWRHDYGDNSYAIQSNFIGCDDVFTVHGPWIGSDSAVVDIGLTAYCTPQLSASIFYQGQFGRDNYNNNAISGGMRWAF